MTANNRAENLTGSETTPRRWKRWIWFFVLTAMIMMVLFFVSLVVFRFQGSIEELGGLINRNENRLLVFRLLLYSAITVGAPLAVFRSVPDAQQRFRYMMLFTILFSVVFIAGELFVIQKIFTG